MSLARIYFESGQDKCALFAMNFARQGRHFLLRLAGGCGGMSAEDAEGLRNLEAALGGEKAGDPQFTGFAVFGGTRMYRGNVDVPNCPVFPTITEVFPNIHDRLGKAVLLGIVSKYNHLSGSPLYGLVIEENGRYSTFTTVNMNCKSILVLQPSSDVKAHQLDEMKEVAGMVDELHSQDWKSLLVVYNGGPNTRDEILTWEANGNRDPDPQHWQILIVRNSGRVANEFALLPDFAKNAKVHFADNNAASLRTALKELDALE